LTRYYYKELLYFEESKETGINWNESGMNLIPGLMKRSSWGWCV